MKNRNLPFIILTVCAVAFAFGVLELFKLRFETGDVFPPCSTLRADPLGASAFYESLEKMPGISVRRDFRPTDEMPEGRGIAYLHLAGQREAWIDLEEDFVKELETFVKAGGRLVIALAPEPAKPYESQFAKKFKEQSKGKKTPEKDKDQPKSKTKPEKTAKNKQKIKADENQFFHSISLAERWGIGFEIKDLKKGEGGAYEPVMVDNPNEPSLPESMSWHSGVVMTNLDKAWRVIYARDADPVLAERRFGAGAVVFATDSYFLSNEAMQKDRHAEVLAWVAGSCRQVMFDEAHLGITDNPGIAALLKKYRLHGLVAGFLALAGLFIWKNSTGFGPVRDETADESFVAGKDSAAGFVNLLRHHVKTPDILNTCVTEWRKSLPKGKFSQARIERVEAFLQEQKALPPKARNPVSSYQTICRLLKQDPDLPVPNPVSPTNPQKI